MTLPRQTSRFALVASVLAALLTTLAPTPVVHATVAPPPTEPVAETPTSEPPVTTNDFLDLERDVTQCISSNPLPGCGREPTSSGDRGGWQQLLLFGILIAGLGIVFGRVFVAVKRGDKNS
mgnify:CR=1 FL=1